MSETAALTQPELRNQLLSAWYPKLCLLLILLGGASLRVMQASDELWLDELHTSWVVADTWADIPARARIGNQSPLYFYLVWAVVQLVGHACWSLRLVSLVAGTTLIAAAAWLVHRWSHSTTAALLAALLVALNRDSIFYAQEARPLCLDSVMALLHAAVFIDVLKCPTRLNRMLMVLGAAGLFYLHYTAALLLIAEAVCLLVLFTCKHSAVRYRPALALCDLGLVGIALLPTWPHILEIAARRQNWARIASAWPLPFGLQLALLVYGVIPLAAAVWSQGKRLRFSLIDVCWIWAFCWFAVPILIAWWTTYSDVAALLMVRYLVAAVIGAIIFAGLSFAAVGSWTGRLVLATLLVGWTLHASGVVPQIAKDGRATGDRNELWGEAVSWLNDRLSENPQPVFLCPGLLEDLALSDQHAPELIEYCLFPVTGIHRLETPHLEPLPSAANVILSPSQLNIVEQHGGCWLIVRGSAC